MELSWMVIVALGFVGFFAGFIDAIAGGGGLLTMPALLTLTNLPPQVVMGTNKGQSVFGSGMALARYAGTHLLDRKRCWVAFAPALIGAGIGVWLVTLVPPDVLRPLVVVLLACVAVFMIFYRAPQVKGPVRRTVWLAVPIAFVIAAYDGFFGPGTGTFLILAYSLVFHDPLDAASANAKVVNFASNLSSMLLFWLQGWIVWKVALPMAAGQLAGSWLGAHLTIRHGRGLVRYAVVVVSLALVCKLGWQLWRG